MKGDFTRFTFDPRKRYTNVFKQQGRVDLDADWNEQSAIDSYLDRVSRMDLSGVESGAPALSPGFQITVPAGGGDLNISAGRFYAKGLVCELFEPTTYLTQPFPPASPPVFTPVPAGGRIDTVYLDVWQRHVTAIEDPSIKEIALGGPDTTTRLQTVFQIRINEGAAAGVTCSTASLPAPSGALMSASLVPVPPEDDPCLIGATAGYRGLENRLYRVEVHDGGALGTATFKWSRDNGSVVFPISEFVVGQPTKIRVTRLGRDQVLALHEGDWVEVLDDNNEFLGTPGTMARVQHIDPANRELTLSAAVSGTMTAHPRVRRWDQSAATLPTAATATVLEDGVQVGFGGGNFKTGDYWMFAARATDGSIETLAGAAARGIEHVYAQLAIVTWTGPTTATVHDCRNIFPKAGDDCCCCSVTVGDGSSGHGDYTSIQAAIDALPATAELAEVCILPGRHNLETPVVVRRDNVVIRGCGGRSPIRGTAAGAFVVEGARNVRLEGLVVGAPGICLVARGARELVVSHCHLDASRSGYSIQVLAGDCEIAGNQLTGGIHVLDGSRDIRISGNRIVGGHSPGVALGGVVGFSEAFRSMLPYARGIVRAEIHGNLIQSNTEGGICTLYEDDARSLGVRFLGIAENQIVANARGAVRKGPIASGGIVLEHVAYLRIRSNEILGNGSAAREACGIFLSGCAVVDIDGNSVLENGSARGVIAMRCADYTTVPAPNPPQNPRHDPFRLVVERADDKGTKLPSAAIAANPIDGAMVVGLPGAPRVTFTHPSAESAELTLLCGSGVKLQVAGFDASGNQVASASVGGGGVQTVPLQGPGLERVVITSFQSASEAEVRYVVQGYCRLMVPRLEHPQGGIIAVDVSAYPDLDIKATSPTGDPAIRVHDNVVVTPAGHSLLIGVIGPVSVQGNSLSSNGALEQPGIDSSIAYGVLIYNFGNDFGTGKTSFLMVSNFLDPAARGFGRGMLGVLGDGRVSFLGNQVAYRALNGTVETGAWVFGIIGFGASQIAGNQFVAEAPGRLLGADLVAMGNMVSITGNSFWEIPDGAAYSVNATARDVIVSSNQSMHCLYVNGLEQTIDGPNQIKLSAKCPNIARRLQAATTKFQRQ